MEKFRIHYKATYEDFLAASKAATYNTPTLVLIIAMGVISALTILALLTGWLALDNQRLLFYLLPPGMFVFFLVITPINLRREAKKSAQAAEEETWTISEKGIRIKKGEQTSKHPWVLFAKARQLPEHILLIYKANRASYIFIPMRAFENPQQRQAFERLIGQHLGK